MSTEFSEEYAAYDGLGLAGLVRKGEVSPTELVEAAIARIERLNPQLNAVVRPLFDRARDQARGDLPDGPFRGVPFVLKDLLSRLAGVPLSSGCRFLRDYVPAENSEVVNRYLATGAVVVGKTNTPEFGMAATTEPALWGATHNPWDLARTTGGSSGGTAAAVAARLVPLGGGGDGGGSIRIPSSCCGLFGLKPTRGRVPVGPQETEIWSGCATEHVLTRSVRDSAAMLDALAGPLVGDWHQLPPPAGSFLQATDEPPGQLRIAVTGEPLLPCAGIDPDVRAGLTATMALLTELGHEVVEARPRLDARALGRAYVTMVGANTYAQVRDSEVELGRRARRGDLERTTWLSYLVGKALPAGELVRTLWTLQRAARTVHEFMEGYDVLLTPTLARPPVPLGSLAPQGLDAVLERLVAGLKLGGLVTAPAALDKAVDVALDFLPFTPVFNISGQPSMSVPLWWSTEGLPVGMMFSGRAGSEATLFRLAAQLEDAKPWIDRTPSVV